MNDRRGQPRVKFEGEAIVVAVHEQLRVACVDLSAGGIAVLASRSPKRLERVRIHATIGNDALVGEALVVRARRTPQGHLWGMRFVNLDELTRANLQRFVQQQLSISARQRQAQLFTARIQLINAQRGQAAAQAASQPDQPAPEPRAEAPHAHASAPPNPPGQVRRDTVGHEEGSSPSALPPSLQTTLQGESQDPPVDPSNAAFRSGIDLPSSNTHVQFEDNSARGHEPGRGSQFTGPDLDAAKPSPTFADESEPSDAAMVFDPGVDHQADLIDDSPVGVHTGDSSMIVLHEEEPAGEAAPTQKPASKAPLSAQRPVADLSQDEDVAAFLASVEADAGAHELAAEAELVLPEGTGEDEAPEPAEPVVDEPEEPSSIDFVGVVPPDFDEECATNQVPQEHAKRALQMLEEDTSYEVVDPDDIEESEDEAPEAEDAPTGSHVAASPSSGPESIATVDLDGPEALDALSGPDPATTLAGEEESVATESEAPPEPPPIIAPAEPLPMARPLSTASTSVDEVPSFQEWEQNNLGTPLPGELDPPDVAAEASDDEQPTLHEGARTIARPPTTSTTPTTIPGDGSVPSFDDWEQSHHTPAPGALQMAAALTAPGPEEAPPLAEWEANNLTPSEEPPLPRPPSTGRGSLSHKVRGPLRLDSDAVPQGVFGDISVAARKARDSQRPRSYSVADLTGSEEDLLSDDDEDAFASLAAEPELEGADADAPTFAKLREDPSSPLDVSGEPYPDTHPHASSEIPTSTPPTSRAGDAEPPTSPGHEALPDFGDPIPASGFAIAASDAFESDHDMSQSGFTMVVHMSDVGFEPPPKPDPSPSPAPPARRSAPRSEPSGFAVMPPSYDNTGLSHESPFQAVLVPGPVGATQPPPAQSGSTVVASIEEIRAQHEAASARVAQQNALSSFVPSFQVQADMDTSSGAYEPSPIAPPLPEVPNLATSDAQQTRFDGPKPVAKIPLKSTPAADAKPPKGPDEINKTIERPPLHERKTQEAPSPSSSSTGPLATGRHAMVQEALAKLRRRADVDAGASSSRKKAAKRAATNGGASAPPPTQNRSRRRRRRLSAAESQNPELLDLYQKALADLDAETKF